MKAACYCMSCGGQFGVDITPEADHECELADLVQWCGDCGAELNDHETCDNDHDEETE